MPGRLIRYALLSLVTLIGLLLLLLILLSVPPGERLLKGIIESETSSALGERVSIGGFETNLISRIQVDDLKIESYDDSAATYLTVVRIHVEYDIWKLLHREIAIEAVDISGVQVFIERDSSGSFNVALLDSVLQGRRAKNQPTDISESEYSLGVGTVSITDLSVSYQDHLLPLSVKTSGVKARVDSDVKDSYRVALTIDSSSLSSGNLSLNPAGLSLIGALNGQSIRIDSTLLTIGDLLVSARGEVPLDDSTSISINVTVSGNPDDLLEKLSAAFELPAIRVHGDIMALAHISGASSSPVVGTRLSLPETDIAGGRIDSVAMTAVWRGDSLIVDSIDVNLLDGRLHAFGLISLDSIPTSEATLELSNLELQRIWTAFSTATSPYRGKLNGKVYVVAVGDNWRGWTVKSQLYTRQTMYRGERIADLDATMSLADGSARLGLKHEFLNANAEILADADSLHGTISLDIADLEPLATFAGLSDLRGKLKADGDLFGTFASPGAHLDVHGKEISYRNIPMTELTAEISYADSTLRIDSLSASGEVPEIDPGSPPLDINLLGGGFAYTLTASGTPDDLFAAFDVTLTNPEYSGLILDGGHLSIKLDGNQLTLSEAELHRDSLLLLLQGSYNLDRSEGSLALTITNVDSSSDAIPTADTGRITAEFAIPAANRIRAFSQGHSVDLAALEILLPDTTRLSGRFDYELDFRGDLSDPTLSLNVQLSAPVFNEFTLDSAEAEVTVDNRILELRGLQAFKHGEMLSASASVGLALDSSGQLTVTDQSQSQGQLQVLYFDLKLLQPFLPDDARLSGRGDLDLTWLGRVEAPHPRGNCSLHDAGLVLGSDIDSIQNFNLALSLEDSLITVDSANGLFRGKPFDISGSLAATRWDRFHADLTAHLADIGDIRGSGMISQDSLDFSAGIDSLDLALLQYLLPDLDTLAGTLDCRLRATGEPANPQINGELRIENLALRLADFTDGFDRGGVRLSFAGNQVLIDTIYLYQKQGMVSLRGRATLDTSGVSDVDVAATVKQIKLTRPDELTAAIHDAALTYKKEKDLYMVRGSIMLDESRLVLDLEPEAILPWAQTVERADRELPALLQQTRLDVRIRESNKLWIDNNLARVRLHAELGLIGSPAQPNFTGRVSIEEGYLLYFDRKFKVTEGVLYFTDPAKFNPEVHLRAQTEVTSYEGIQGQSYLITISVQGTVAEPQILLGSEPPLDNPDIVSILTLGATRSQLTGRNADSRNVFLRRAESLSSSRISGFVGSRVESVLGLDQVSVEGNLFSPAQSNGIQFLAAKRITDRAKLTYTTTVGQLNDQSIRLDYKLSGRFSFEGETNRQGDSRISFKYGLLFR